MVAIRWRAFLIGSILALVSIHLRAGSFESPPGADPYPAGLRNELARAVAAKGSDYRPRTRHLLEDGSARYVNRLILESSPYLRQHAHNPVDWFPWGDEAFEMAVRTGRPILLSIGYSTCHWCHVMEEESFEDPEIARLLNTRYVAIKVDREERPDLDAIYMRAVQALTGRGGWPMTTWLTPQGQPFFGGTYFPARDGERGSRKGFLSLLRELAEVYEKRPAQVASRAAELTARIRREALGAADEPIPTAKVLHEALSSYRSLFDPEFGGLQRAPKFPSTLPIRLLLRSWRRTGEAAYREMAELTLNRMADGGLYDQVGGGFHRYSTDARWLVPHFEKMLYDNALLVSAYLEGFQATGDPRFAAIAEETLGYVTREMTAEEGGFYSATDADSMTPDGHREEGWFFTWTPAEIRRALGEKRARFVEARFGVSAAGNFEGRNILHVARTIEESARIAQIDPAAAREELARARELLYRTRAQRPAPLRDDKILAAWNGLMISAFARAAHVLGRRELATVAGRAAEFVLGRMVVDGRLRRSHHDGRPRHNAYLDDYAFLVAGLLDLYEATGEASWVRRAIELHTTLDSHYWDEAGGGYFLTSDDHEKLLSRDKPDHDGAEPSGNSVALLNLLRLHALTLDDGYRKRADALSRAFGTKLLRYPTALNEMLIALDFRLADPREVILVAPSSREELEPFLRRLRGRYAPNVVLSLAVEGSDLERQARHLPPLRGKVARDGKATAYVCRSGFCRLPVTDPGDFVEQLTAEVAQTPEKIGSDD